MLCRSFTVMLMAGLVKKSLQIDLFDTDSKHAQILIIINLSTPVKNINCCNCKSRQCIQTILVFTKSSRSYPAAACATVRVPPPRRHGRKSLTRGVTPSGSSVLSGTPRPIQRPVSLPSQSECGHAPASLFDRNLDIQER